MKKNLFLLGDIGTGKSTLIREALLPHLPRVGGFFVQRILIKGRCAAFRLQPVETAAAYRINEHVSTLDGLTNLFLYSDAQGRWRQDSAVFSGVGTGCLERSMASGKELILLDELGGIELGCTSFMEAVRAVLDSSIPVLGVYKAPRNAAKLAGCLGDGSTGSANRAVLDYLQSHPLTGLYTVNAAGCSHAARLVKAFVEAHLE